MANCITVDESKCLNVLQPEQFEDKHFNQEVAHQIQAGYYKGTPPQWVNFYLAEKKITPFVKRDGYEKIKCLIEKQKTTKKTVTEVNLIHQSGSGGSTLAMQVLWDLRKDLLCMKLKETDTDLTVISQELIKLGLACVRKPVLLLLDNVNMLKDCLQKSLRNSLIDEMNKINVNDNTNVPIVIILNCVRKAVIRDESGKNTVLLKSKLQDTERQEFEDHICKISEFFGNEPTKLDGFYGFNIIQKDFNHEYVQDVCDCIIRRQNQEQNSKQQLFAILALVNSYAPGSNFALDQCVKFLLDEKYSVHKLSWFKNQMKPFSKLLVNFTFEGLTFVRVAHPMIAKRCIELLALNGTKKGEVTCLFLKHFESPHLMMTVKAMLTMRESTVETSNTTSSKTNDKTIFSNLITDIMKCEGKPMCITVLEKATKMFDKSPTFPQALARCYYLMYGTCLGQDNQCMSKTDYEDAEQWANLAIERDDDNSFIMDTLGEVHKHHLRHYLNKNKYCKSEDCIYANKEVSDDEALTLGRLAITAFKNADDAAEEESEKVKTDGFTNISRFFNTSGKRGYLQVVKTLTKHSLTLEGCQENVSQRTTFFEKYFTYSQSGYSKVDQPYVDKPDITNLTKLKAFLKRTNASPEIYHHQFLEQSGAISNKAVTEMRLAYERVYRKYFHSRYLTPLYMMSTEGWQTLSQLNLKPWEIEKGVHKDSNETEETARLRPLARIRGRVEKADIVADMEGTEINVQPHIKENLLGDGNISFHIGFNIQGPVAFNIKYE